MFNAGSLALQGGGMRTLLAYPDSLYLQWRSTYAYSCIAGQPNVETKGRALLIQRIFYVCLVILIALPGLGSAAPALPNVSAKSAIVIEAATGKIIYEKKATQAMYPASTTKIMTLIAALEQGNLEDVLTVSANAANTEGSSIYLEPGERLKLLEVLYGVMLHSGNDATVAVAEHISGSVEKFSRLMTDKARAIGAAHTNFTNPNGLPDPNHYTTAHDLAKITAYGYRNPLFRKIVGTRHQTIPWNNKGYDRDLYNENKLLWNYEGADGVKTGYTEAAGQCLVSSAVRDNIRLVAVVLDSDQMWDDSKALLNFGFSKLRPVELFKKGDILKTSPVADGKSDRVQLAAAANLIAPVSDDDLGKFQIVADVPDKIEAPFKAGQTVGVARILYQGSEMGKVDLIATTTVERDYYPVKMVGYFSVVVAAGLLVESRLHKRRSAARRAKRKQPAAISNFEKE